MAGGKVTDKDRGWAGILKRVASVKSGAHVKVGILGDASKGGIHVPGSDLTVAEYGAVNEFGTEDKRVPERSFLRSTFDEQRPALEAAAAKLFRGVIDGRVTVQQGLGILGAKFTADVKNKITSGTGVPPPNAPSTLARKLRVGKWNKGGKAQARGWGVRTLVDQGRLLGAITYVVVMGDAAE